MFSKVESLFFMKRFIKYWLPVIGYALLIFCVSSIPGKNIPSILPKQDIPFHFIEYVLFALLVSRAFKEYQTDKKHLRRFFWVSFFLILYAFSDEFHQKFILNRTASLSDIAIDGLGSIIGGIFYK